MEQLATLLLMVMKGGWESKENDSVVAECMLREGSKLLSVQRDWSPNHLRKTHLVTEGSLFYFVSLYGEEEGNTLTQCLLVWFFTLPSHGVERNPLSCWDSYWSDKWLYERGVTSPKDCWLKSRTRILFTAVMESLYFWLSRGGISRKHGEADRRQVDDHLKRNSTGQ